MKPYVKAFGIVWDLRPAICIVMIFWLAAAVSLMFMSKNWSPWWIVFHCFHIAVMATVFPVISHWMEKS